MPPLVAVITPAYNSAHWLPFSLDSVLAQTYPEWVAVVVDDGSTDQTPAVLDSYRERMGGRLRAIRQSNAGMSAARNTAIAAAEDADYVAFLDADDIWLPRRLASAVEALEARPQAALSYGRMQIINEDGQPGALSLTPPSPAGGPGLAPRLYQRQLHLPCCTVTVRRAALEGLPLFDVTLPATEDRDLFFRLALHHEILFINELVALYRHSANQLTKDPSRMIQGQLGFLRKNYGQPGCGFWAYRRALSSIYREQGQAHLRRGTSGQAAVSYLRALGCDPTNRQAWVQLVRGCIFHSRGAALL